MLYYWYVIIIDSRRDPSLVTLSTNVESLCEVSCQQYDVRDVIDQLMQAPAEFHPIDLLHLTHQGSKGLLASLVAFPQHEPKVRTNIRPPLPMDPSAVRNL